MNKRLKFNHLFFGGLLRSPCLLCLAANSSALGLCQPCLSDPPYFDACYGVFSYQFPISSLLQDYKYGSKLQSASRITGQRIAILDDVMTTGASLNELAKTLKQAGASHVECWIVARTLARP